MATRLSKGILDLIKRDALDRASISSAVKEAKRAGDGAYAITLVQRDAHFRRIKGKSHVIVVEVDGPDISVELSRENRRRHSH